MGEEVAQYNGAYKVTEGLWKKWGDKRVVDTPITEAGFIGMGIGASHARRAAGDGADVLELRTTVAWDQIINNAGMRPLHARRPDQLPHRHPRPGQRRHQRRRHPLAHARRTSSPTFPGLKVVCPATAYDAKGLMKAAIRDNDPVMFMENTAALRREMGSAREQRTARRRTRHPARRGRHETRRHRHLPHRPRPRRAHLPRRPRKSSQAEHGINAEVVDLRSIRPLDEETILDTVRKTHRAIYVEENKPFCGVGAQIAAMIQEKCFDELDAPVLRVSALDAPAIYSPPLEKIQLPYPEVVVAKALSIC